MTLPNDFQFSQASLQDYKSCPRRFKLRYLDRLRWPAIESEPVQEAERLARLGTSFHQLVRQHVDYQTLPDPQVDVEAILAETLQHDETGLLADWWRSYLTHQPPQLAGATVYPEITFSTPLHGHRIVARFDLLAVQPDGQFVIIDWKTSQKKPPRYRLADRFQTYVYPYVFAKAGTAFNDGQPIKPDRISLIYWYPVEPEQPEIFRYSIDLFERDERIIGQMITRVQKATSQNDFPMVENPRPCSYCVYRSLCERGDKAGPLIEMEAEVEDSLDLESLDWDQIAEIQF
ncbi:PD-(D/E)XK nuclease family protein [Anaerolineales bacterium HSG25]|nr:PD-(D/E)XK nuclease family protein [Anaerolineales bacterium HSG25]